MTTHTIPELDRILEALGLPASASMQEALMRINTLRQGERYAGEIRLRNAVSTALGLPMNSDNETIRQEITWHRHVAWAAQTLMELPGERHSAEGLKVELARRTAELEGWLSQRPRWKLANWARNEARRGKKEHGR